MQMLAKTFGAVAALLAAPSSSQFLETPCESSIRQADTDHVRMAGEMQQCLSDPDPDQLTGCQCNLLGGMEEVCQRFLGICDDEALTHVWTHMRDLHRDHMKQLGCGNEAPVAQRLRHSPASSGSPGLRSNKPILVRGIDGDGAAVAPTSNKPILVRGIDGDGAAVAPTSNKPILVRGIDWDGAAVAPTSNKPILVRGIDGDGAAVAPTSNKPILVRGIDGDRAAKVPGLQASTAKVPGLQASTAKVPGLQASKPSVATRIVTDARPLVDTVQGSSLPSSNASATRAPPGNLSTTATVSAGSDRGLIEGFLDWGYPEGLGGFAFGPDWLISTRQGVGGIAVMLSMVLMLIAVTVAFLARRRQAPSEVEIADIGRP